MARRPAVEPHACRDPGDAVPRRAPYPDSPESPEAPMRGAPDDAPPPGRGERWRAAIHDSWLRSRQAGVDTGLRAAPLVFDADVLDDARAAHPFDRHVPMLRGLLRQVADAST